MSPTVAPRSASRRSPGSTDRSTWATTVRAASCRPCSGGSPRPPDPPPATELARAVARTPLGGRTATDPIQPEESVTDIETENVPLTGHDAPGSSASRDSGGASEADLRRLWNDVRNAVGRAVVGAEEPLRLVLTALLADGHVLVEDVPGTGKTLLARAIARALGLATNRIQGTPDLLPADVTGSSLYEGGTLRFAPGPVFTNVLLIDEINRATPRTQSAMLEAMQERQVTVEGTTHRLPDPFLVIATQNPVEFEGTFALPQAQLDRFLLRAQVGYPDDDGA